MDYAVLTLAQVRSGLDSVARDAQATFAGLDARQLNWHSDAKRWSVAQCFEHLLRTNDMLLRAADSALDPDAPRTMWQRLPLLPGLLGPMLVRSQSPNTTRRFPAPSRARPAVSAIDPDIIQRFVEQHRSAVTRMQTVDERAAASAVMASPLVRMVTFSVLNGWRLMLAHDRRHFEQARRVTQALGFPAA